MSPKFYYGRMERAVVLLSNREGRQEKQIQYRSFDFDLFMLWDKGKIIV